MKEKYALFDTDFISKMHQIQKDDNNHLIDRIIEMPDYKFFCHEQIVKELNRRPSPASKWLNKQIEKGIIVCFSDKKILEELSELRGNLCCMTYTQMLRNSCETFRKTYFENFYDMLDNLNYSKISNEDYLIELSRIEESIGIQSNIGEIKTFVLHQFLNMIYGKKVYVFCSDDNNARQSAIYFKNTLCISVLSSFVRLKNTIHLNKDDAKPYIESWLKQCVEVNRTTFRVLEAKTNSYQEPRVIRVPCRQVMKDIYEDKLIELKNGMLRYKE